MFRNLAAAAIVLAVSLGLAMADPVKGRITKIDGKKITVMVGAKKDAKGEEKTFEAAADVKVSKKAGKDGEKTALTGGLGAAELKNIDEKGVGAVLEVTDGKVTEITIMVRKKE